MHVLGLIIHGLGKTTRTPKKEGWESEKKKEVSEKREWRCTTQKFWSGKQSTGVFNRALLCFCLCLSLSLRAWGYMCVRVWVGGWGVSRHKACRKLLHEWELLSCSSLPLSGRCLLEQKRGGGPHKTLLGTMTPPPSPLLGHIHRKRQRSTRLRER